MAAACVSDTLKNILFPYAVKHAWQMRALEVVDHNNKEYSRIELLTGQLPKFVLSNNNFFIWGEAGVVKDTPKNAAKSRERGVT